MNKHYEIRSIPFCGVKVLYLPQMISLDHQLWATVNEKKKREKKWYPGGLVHVVSGVL